MRKIILTILTTFLLLTCVACGDDGLVKVKIDAMFYAGASEEEIVKENHELGLTYYNINKDGSVTYEIEKAQYELIRSNYISNLDVICKEFTSGEEKIASFDEIKYSENLDEFNFIVNENYDSMDATIAIPFLIMGAYYQNFSGQALKDIDVLINFIDQKTSNILDSISFQELLNVK